MIEDLVKSIQTNQLDLVYSSFKKIKIAHHKDLLLCLCIEHNHPALYKTLISQYVLTPDSIPQILKTTFKQKDYFEPVDHFKYPNEFFKTMSLTDFDIIFKKGDKAVDNFFNNQPLSIYLNFNKYIISAFKNGNISAAEQIIPHIKHNTDNALFIAIAATYYNQTSLYPKIFNSFASNKIYIDEIEEQKLIQKISQYFISDKSYQFKFMQEEKKSQIQTAEHILQLFKDETSKATATIIWNSITPSIKKNKSVKF